MSSNKKNLLYTIPIILVLFSIFVQAGDFTFTQGKGIENVCPRATGLFTDVIKNSGEEQQFTVNVEGSAAVWSTAVPSGFNLLPGQEKTVYTYVTPFETAQPGNYEVGVVVTTSNGVKKLSHPVVVKECYDASLNQNQAGKNVCPNDKAVAFESVLTNLGEYQESYDLSAEGDVASWVKLSETKISLDKGAKKSVFAYVDIPEDAEGQREFNIIAKGLSRGSDTLKSVTYKVNVEPCYKFDIAAQKNAYSLCEAAKLEIPVLIKNDGTVDNSYSISVSGAEWASLSKTSVTLKPAQSESVNIVLTPNYKIEGKSNIDIEVIPVKGILKAIDSFEIEVRKCHSVQMDIVKTDDRICNDVVNAYDIIINNDGEVNKEYKLEAIGAWKWLDQDKISVNAGEKKTIKLNVRPPIDAEPRVNTINVKATALDESAVSAEDEIKITNVDIAKCYEPEIIIIPDNVVVYYDSAATIPVQVKNKGEKQAKYELVVSGSAVNFVQLSPSAITVDAADAKVANLYIAPSAQVIPKDYEAVVGVRLDDTTLLKTKSVKIRVTENKDEATIGLTSATIAVPEGGLTLWQKLKNWWNGLFAPKEVSNETSEVTETPTAETNESLGEVSDEVVAPVVPEENKTEETPIEVAPVEETPVAEELKTVRRQMGEGDTYLFSFNNEQHSVKVDKISDNKTQITVSSAPVVGELNIGESKDFDLNGDGVNDIKVTLNGYTESGKADLTYEVIKPEETASTGNGILSRTWQGIVNYKYYILAGIVILIILILINKTGFHKKVVDFFEEDIEEEEVKKEEPPKQPEVHKEEKKKKKE